MEVGWKWDGSGMYLSLFPLLDACQLNFASVNLSDFFNL